MKPEDRYPTNRFSNPRQAQSSNFSQPQTSSDASDSQNQAAANIVRDKIDNIYDQAQTGAPSQTDSTEAQTQSQASLDASNPYQRTAGSASQNFQAEQWKQYHSAWQNYYQKYYERYYISKIQENSLAQNTTDTKPAAAASQPKDQAIYSKNPTEELQEKSDPEVSQKQHDALVELKNNLLQKVKTSAKKVQKSNHFVPIASALAVVLVFVFLQYNRVLISNVKAYISPGMIDPQNIVVDPSASIEVGPEPKLIIPKINVDVPVVYGVGADNDSQMKAMEQGIAHFSIPGASSTPGQIGNTVLSGHSSNDLFDQGEYKFIFAQLDKVSTGDMIYANFEGTRYSYTVTKKEVVLPTSVQSLIYPTDKPILTLITCTPLGTAEKRLLVTAEQVSPDPTQGRPSPDSDVSPADSGGFMPSNSPTLTERLFNR